MKRLPALKFAASAASLLKMALLSACKGKDPLVKINKLNGVKACVFDAYGTLLDVAAAAESCRDALGEKVAPWRNSGGKSNWNTLGFAA